MGKAQVESIHVARDIRRLPMELWQVRGVINGVLTGAAGQLKHPVVILKMPRKYFQDDLLVILAALLKGALAR